MGKLSIKRIYDEPSDKDGTRTLVDRLWPRGISKIKADLNSWDKEVAPSTDLREWFQHDPSKFALFKEKYLRELKANPYFPQFVQGIVQALKKGNVTLLYGAKDTRNNQALVLLQTLEQLPEIQMSLS